jgi:hypothetical protein
VAVYSPEQVALYRRLFPHADERLFLKSGATETEEEKGGVVFEESDAEVDVDNI